MELKYWKNKKAESYYVSHPTNSWAVFMINDSGDLMINSDWGVLINAWRSFADEGFKKFLTGLDEGDWKTKMTTNLLQMRVPKKEIDFRLNHIWPIFKIFQNLLEQELDGIELPVK